MPAPFPDFILLGCKSHFHVNGANSRTYSGRPLEPAATPAEPIALSSRQLHVIARKHGFAPIGLLGPLDSLSSVGTRSESALAWRLHAPRRCQDGSCSARVSPPLSRTSGKPRTLPTRECSYGFPGLRRWRDRGGSSGARRCLRARAGGGARSWPPGSAARRWGSYTSGWRLPAARSMIAQIRAKSLRRFWWGARSPGLLASHHAGQCARSGAGRQACVPRCRGVRSAPRRPAGRARVRWQTSQGPAALPPWTLAWRGRLPRPWPEWRTRDPGRPSLGGQRAAVPSWARTRARAWMHAH